MKKFAASLLLALPLCFGNAFAQDKAPTKQQGKMATCNADAKTKELKGAERKAFMKECLSSSASTSQQTKMKTCNADAKEKALKGADRKAFMKECLSK